VKLVYTDEAIDDLKRLREFVMLHNPTAATRIAFELVGNIELLPNFPKMGTPVAMAPIPDSVRDMVFGKCVVRYSVHASAIIILRLWHGLEGERVPAKALSGITQEAIEAFAVHVSGVKDQ